MRIGIIGAMSEEVQGIKKLMTDIEEEKIGTLTFYTGVMHDKDIVLLETGIGKVNAAIGATLMIEAFDVEEIIFTGVAGGINEEVDLGDVVISRDLIQHDFDTSAFGDKLGMIPRMDNSIFKADDELIELAVNAGKKLKGKVIVGRVLSGDQFIASPEKIAFLKKEFNGDCTEMEGAAVGHVCQVLDIPFVVIRTMSDKANSDAHTDYATFMRIAADNSVTLVNEMLSNIK